MRLSTKARSRTVRMFLARPRFRWNSPKRRMPNSASRIISSDHQSPIKSNDRAIGHSAPSKLVRFTMAASARVNYLVALLNQKAPDSSSALATQTGAYYEVGKQDGVNHGWQQRDRPGYRAAVRGGGR